MLDREKWNLFRKGDKDSFESIYKENVDFLYNYGMQIFRDSELVKDAIQDLFVYLWKRKESLGETSSIAFYLCKSLKRNIVRRLQSKREESGAFDLLPEDQLSISDQSPFPFENTFQDTLDRLDKAINRLPDRQREIIRYRFYDGLSPNEIAERMSLSIDSTYTVLSRALRELKKNAHRILEIIFLLWWGS